MTYLFAITMSLLALDSTRKLVKRQLLPYRQTVRNVKLTILHLMPKSRTRGGLTPSLHNVHNYNAEGKRFMWNTQTQNIPPIQYSFYAALCCLIFFHILHIDLPFKCNVQKLLTTSYWRGVNTKSKLVTVCVRSITPDSRALQQNQLKPRNLFLTAV